MPDYNKTQPFKSNGYQSRNPRENQSLSFPQGYLTGGYFKEGALKHEYMMSWAEQLAKLLTSDRDKLSKSKVRAYYEEVVHASDDFERGTISEAEAIHKVVRLYALANSDVSKKKAPKIFADFLKLNIEAVKTSKDLKAFKEHFESVLCFYPEK